jgi:hypothetical protein
MRAERPSSSINVATVLRTLCGDTRHAGPLAHSPPLLAEVVRVAQRPGSRLEDHGLLTEVGLAAPSHQRLDGEPG